MWTAFRKALPSQQEVDERPDIPYSAVAYRFLKDTPPLDLLPRRPGDAGR